MDEYFIGIDLGGTLVKIGLVCGEAMVDKKLIPAKSAHGLAAGLPFIKQEIDDLLKNNNVSSSVLKGIGLGFPGLVDPNKKKILSTNAKYDDSLDIDLESWVKEHYDVLFFIDNDARMAAVGEWKYGAGKDTNDLVVMTIGTGIGTSAIVEGKLLRGKHFQAGCLGGHFSVQFDGRPCTCGNIGCMEAYAATWSIKERVSAAPGFAQSTMSSSPVIDFEVLFTAAESGDALATSMLEECLDIWSAGIVNLIHAYDPEVVVVGGGVMNNQSKVIPWLKKKVQQHAWCPWGKVDIKPTQLLSNAGIFGAVYCLQHKI